MDTLPTWLPIMLAFVFGSAIGSFLNVLIWRLPRDEKITGRSHCPKCHHQLQAGDLVPLFSFLLFGKKCRYCKTPISWRYFIIELIAGLSFGLAVYAFYPAAVVDWLVVSFYLFVICICILVFVIDLEHYLILDRIILPAIVVVFIWKVLITISFGEPLFGDFILSSIYGSVAAFLSFLALWAISKGRWMGFGDVKFVAFMGMVLGISIVFIALFVAFMLGTIVAVPLLLFGKKELSSKIPFGTFLSVSTIFCLFYGSALLYWYLQIIGLQ